MPLPAAWPPTVEEVASVIAAGTPGRRALVAIDGGDASGKTTYAALLADALREVGRVALVIHVDDFMHLRAIRHRRGRTSPQGYFEDSYDYDALIRHVLEPLGAAGSGRFRTGCTDRARDITVDLPERQASPTTITVVEGLFLLRDELAGWWEYSVFLDVSLDITMNRKSRRDGLSLVPGDQLHSRYVEGWRSYREQHRPHDRATWVVASTDPALESGD